MDEDHFNHIRCTIHKLPINRINKQKQINSSKRALCFKCPEEGASIFHIQQILDSLSTCFQPIHQIYSNFKKEVQIQKEEIVKIINQVYSFFEAAINQSEFDMSQLEKYINYRDNQQEIKIEDLEIISDFIYSEEPQQNLIYKSIKILQQFQSSYKNELITILERLILQIKGCNQPQKTNNSSKKEEKKNDEKHKQQPVQPKQLSSEKPPLQPSSMINRKNNLSFIKKNQYETSLVATAIFNSNGDMLFQGQFAYNQHKNLEIKSIDNNFQIKNQSIQQESDENGQVTALAFNELTTSLFVGYEGGNISTYQYTGNSWKEQANFRAHNQQVNCLIVNQSNTELFSGGQDDIIKGYLCSEGIGPSKKEINSIKNICGIQINKESDYLFIIAGGKLHIYNNSQDFCFEFQQISLQNQRVTCITTVNKQIYVGSDVGRIYIFEQNRGYQYDQVYTNTLFQKSLLLMKYCEEIKILIVQLDDQVSIHQIGSNNQFDRIQEISGSFSPICVQSNKKTSQFILYCQENSKASHYIMQRN